MYRGGVSTAINRMNAKNTDNVTSYVDSVTCKTTKEIKKLFLEIFISPEKVAYEIFIMVFTGFYNFSSYLCYLTHYCAFYTLKGTDQIIHFMLIV